MEAALTIRALSLLPSAEQSKLRALAVFGDLDDLVQNAALAMLEAKNGGLAQVKRGDSVRSLAARARSRSRRYTQDPVYYSRSIDGIDGIADTLAHVAAQPTAARKKREIAREVAADHRVTTRRARQIIAAQVERARQGDLFADDGSDDGEKGEK